MNNYFTSTPVYKFKINALLTGVIDIVVTSLYAYAYYMHFYQCIYTKIKDYIRARVLVEGLRNETL